MIWRLGMRARKLLCRSQTRIDLLFTMSKIPQARPLGARMRSDVFADVCFWRSGLADRWSARLRSRATTWQPSPFLLRGCATRSPKGEAWWSQAGSNRRPRHCERRALPAELWPRRGRLESQNGRQLAPFTVRNYAKSRTVKSRFPG